MRNVWGRGLLLAALCCLWAGAGYAMELSLGEKGINIKNGSMGEFTVSYPKMEVSKEKYEDPSEVKVNGNTAEISYSCGAKIAAALDGDEIKYIFSSLPAGVASYRSEMLINLAFTSGAWSIDGKDGTFPAEKAQKPQIFSDKGEVFTLIDSSKNKLIITPAPYTFMQVQDNREWNWEIFQLSMFTPIVPDNMVHVTKIVADDAAAQK